MEHCFQKQRNVVVGIGDVFDEIVIPADDAAAIFRGELVGSALGRVDAAVRGVTLDGRIEGAGPVVLPISVTTLFASSSILSMTYFSRR